ncbi:hypothetical protein [uncultured Prevotella sp.]|jgi:hypothetical protein|uniref:hypothetical protein n=1 Tax=uncultured Prevotella sp. TaxID=159272 RepID=UPI002588C4FA|nr:hypothetical protein [uncultured Prevotella sp.]
MKFLMQGIEIDTTKVKYKPALEDVLLMVTKTYYPDIKLSKVEYDFDEKNNSVILTFYRDTKYHLLGDIKDVDAKLITGLPEDVFYPTPGKNYFFLLGYADGYYIEQKDIKDEFISCQAIEDVKDVCFSTSDSYLKIMIYGK